MQPTLVFVRHGETSWNAEGRLQGQRDIPLNDKGRGQALRNGRALADSLAELAEFDFVASPLGRARETMEIVREALGLDPAAYRLDDRLKEVAFGEWEGSTLAELKVSDPKRIEARDADLWRFKPDKGESYQGLSERVGHWFESLERPTLAVAHGGVGRVLRVRLFGVDPNEAVGWTFPQDKAFRWQSGAETLI